MENEGGAFVYLTGVILICADDDIREPVTVHITRAGHAMSKQRLTLSRHDGRVRVESTPAQDTGRAAVEYESCTFVFERPVVVGGADDDISISVSIDVASTGDIKAEPRKLPIRFER